MKIKNKLLIEGVTEKIWRPFLNILLLPILLLPKATFVRVFSKNR